MDAMKILNKLKRKKENSNQTFENLKQREETHNTKSYNKKYYFSEEAKVKGKQLYQDKKEYIKNNPEDFEIVGADLFGILYHVVEKFPPEERHILSLTGEGKYYESQKDYQRAISFYKQAIDLTLVVCKDDIEELIKDHGPGDYLYTAKLKQRIKVCEMNITKEKAKKLEAEAKELEKTNPAEAIKIYEELNVLKPGLKKYNKRIEICKKKL